MKITDVSWRSRIGRSRCQKCKQRVVQCDITGFDCSLEFLPPLLICILLLVAGIEQNPGPGNAKVTFMDVSHRMMMIHIDDCKGSTNPRHTTSKWGKLSQKLMGNNTLKLRQFLENLNKSIPQFQPMRYADTTLNNIFVKLRTFEETELSVTNVVQTNSVWGFLSVSIYGSNSIQDRHFLSTLWGIGNEVEDVSQGIFVNLLPKKGPTRDNFRKKRSYDKTVKKPKGKIQNPTAPHLSPTSDEDINQQDPLLQRLKDKYSKDIWNFPSFPCQMCDFMVYPNCNFRHTIKVNTKLKDEFEKIDKEYNPPEELIVCNRCYNNLHKYKIPPKAKINLLALRPVPKQIQILTIPEIRLVCQVKAFMKIILLCNGKGQKLMKGLVVHFPQQVDEVINQLPLKTSSADIIIVHEKHDRFEHVTDLKVRPKMVYDALSWLVTNNPLYKNIVINNDVQFDDLQSMTLDRSQPASGNAAYEGANVSYVPISDQFSSLQASFCQSHAIFLNNAGRQCMAMAASFLAHANIDSPLSWCRQTLDDVLLLGNDLYSERRSGLHHDHSYLAIDEVTGNFKAFGGVEIQIDINNNLDAITFQGFANRAKQVDFPQLTPQIRAFIASGYKHGILTMGDYSMGLFVDGEYTYYFDSHSRGLKGCSTLGENGTACVLKLNNDIAPSKISYLANRNCVSKNLNPNIPNDLNQMRFALTVFDITLIANDTNGDSVSPIVSPTNSPPRKQFHESEIASDSEKESDSDEPHPFQMPDFGRVIESDCVIDNDDVIEPELDDILSQFNLNREDRSPINDHLERNLDLLAFPNLFPYGVNGRHAIRKIAITPLDYFQQRLLSSDKRFAGNTDFLFYALSEADKHRARQKIGIVAQQKRQGNPNGDEEENLGVRDPHVYMSSIRGTSSYWKKYTGDLISMVKTLGVPTFFFTFSFDDLNSPDCINALWKAKHGYDTPDVKPEDIPYDERKTLLNDYPIAAARHFSMRLSKLIALLKSNSSEIFGLELEDYSIRVEFQARGSPHAHCLFWLKNVPLWDTPEGIEFLNRNVSCSASTGIRNMVLKYQRHNHSKTCFKNKHQRCRFAFPKPLCEETTILNDDEIVRNKGRFFNLQRASGEEMINSYHPILLQLLQCNMDIQPVTGAVAIAYYIAKYMSKAEPLEVRQDIADAIKKIQQSELPAQQKMFRIAMTLMRNREISAQEAAFRLCHLFLRYSSRATVFLPTYKKENRVRMLRKESIAQDIPEFCTNIIDRYMGRPPVLEDICLYEFASEFALLPKSKNHPVNDDCDWVEFPVEPPEEQIGGRDVLNCRDPNGASIGHIFKRRKAAIVKHPNFNPVTDKHSYYYSLLLLYRPFRTEDAWDGQDPCALFEAERVNFRNHTHNPILRQELADEIDRAILRMAEFDDEERSEINLEQEFDAGFEETETNVPAPSQEEAFGDDRTHNVSEKIKLMYNGLNVQQKNIFHRVRTALQNSTCNMRLMVLSDAGTGKSFILKLLSLLIRHTLSQDALLIAAPTGKAAYNVGGSTCHRIFGLQVQHGFIKGYQKLNATRLAEFRRLYKNVKWIFIDEISMVSYENFRAIHLRLCEIFGTDGVDPFAGKNIICFGDLCQIPPPKASRVFKKPDKFSAEVDLWRQFQFSELTINMRQGSDPLGKIASELRIGTLSEESLRLLKTRVLNENDRDQLEYFRDAVRIYPQNKQCKVFNKAITKELRKTTRTFIVKARDTHADGPRQGQIYKGALPQKDEFTGGIPNAIELAVGSRVMLRRNLSTEKGHVNGATGVVRNIEWRIDKNRQIEAGDLPKRVLIKFDHEVNETWISCATVDFIGKKQERVSREMLPLILAWALTCHKLQGSTLDKAVVYLGEKCQTKGLAYVAISRVKNLKGLAISELDPKKLLTTAPVGKNKGFNPADVEALAELERLRLTNSDRGDNIQGNCSKSYFNKSVSNGLQNEGIARNIIYPDLDFNNLNIC